MENIRFKKYISKYQNELINLWEKCNLIHPLNDPELDIKKKIEFQPEYLIVGFINKQLVCSIMIGYEGHRGWINYLSVDPDYQRQHIGSAAMNEAEKILKNIGCQKINLQIRKNNIKVKKFYESIGYREDDVISMGKRLI